MFAVFETTPHFSCWIDISYKIWLVSVSPLSRASSVQPEPSFRDCSIECLASTVVVRRIGMLWHAADTIRELLAATTILPGSFTAASTIGILATTVPTRRLIAVAFVENPNPASSDGLVPMYGGYEG